MSTTPRTWVVGEVVTAAELNTEIRDQFNDLFAAWTSYTPTWTGATTNPTIGNGQIQGRYKLVGKLAHFAIECLFGSTTTAGSGAYNFGLPMAAAGSVSRIITGQAVNSAGRADLTCVVTPATSVVTPFAPSSTTPPANQLTSAGMFGSAWSSGSVIRITGTYEPP